MQQLEAHEVPLHKIFSSDYDFRIPDYQRPYAWDVEHATQLLEDVVEALERADDEPYFLGSIVLVKDKESSRSDVIDGQQRLTTLTILLAVLRDLAVNEEFKTGLEMMIQEPGQIIRNLSPKPRLALRQRDADFFCRFVQAPGSIEPLLGVKPDALKTDAQKAVQENAAALHKILADWDDERRLSLVQMLSMRTFLVVVSTPDLGSAHRIFSVMNTRGLDLSPADVFKSQIVGSLADADKAPYAKKWEDAEEQLGREGFADLFLHLRVVVSKERAKRELLKEFPEQVLSLYLPARAREFIDDLVVPYAAAHGEILNGSYTAAHGADKVNAWFKRLDLLDNNDWRPAALWAVRTHHDDPVWLDEYFRALERLAGSMFIRREYTTPRVTRYLELLRQLEDGHGVGARAFDLSVDEQAATIEGFQGELYRAQKIRKYVLLRLDEVLANSPGVTYDLPVITVEHVLPQSPRLDSRWLSEFSDVDREFWTHRLANLVLLNRYKNSEAQNFDFADKKSKYFTGKNGVATFALTSQVLGTERWTPEILELRQKELVEVLRIEWAL